jgi:hypothetical protein
VVACLVQVIYSISLPTDVTDYIIHSLAVIIFSPGKHGAVQRCESQKEGRAFRGSFVAEDLKLQPFPFPPLTPRLAHDEVG